MRELNIAEDDPDEYEGRIVRWWGAEYIIGPFVGEGGERIVHQLINVRSDLSCNVIKVLKDQENAPEPTLQMLEAYKSLRESGIATANDPELVHAHGGWFELDDVALEVDPHYELMTQARQAYDKGDLDFAAEKCQEILVLSPQHTAALELSAVILARRGDLRGAIELGMQILTIEPNVRSYRFMVMEWAANIGLVDLFETLLGELKEKWPGDWQIDNLAAEVALSRGYPDKAQDLHLGSDVELRRRVATEAEALERAKTFLSQASSALERDQSEEVLKYLASAHGEYHKNPVVAINYGLALLRSEEWQKSYDVLKSVASAAPSLLRDGALAAMAVCSVHLDDYKQAASLLDVIANAATAPDGSISYWDLPAVPIWVSDDQELLPLEITMASTIDTIIEHFYGSPTPIPSSLLTMKELYQKGPDDRQDG